jgi:hypothetical protein
MVTGRVLQVTKGSTKQGKDIFTASVEVGGKTTNYQCWDSAIQEKQGKEVSFDVKPAPEGTSFNPTMMLPKGDGNTFKGKSAFTPRPAADPKTMVLAYAKDLIVAMLATSKKEHTPVGIANATVSIYRILNSELEGVKVERTVTAEQVANAVGGKIVHDEEIPF